MAAAKKSAPASAKRPSAAKAPPVGELHWSNFAPDLAEFVRGHRASLKRGTEITFIRMGGPKASEYRAVYAGMGADRKLHVYRLPPALVLNASPKTKWNRERDAFLPYSGGTEGIVEAIGQLLYGNPAAFAHSWT